jgi:hypothetical protein
LISIKCGSIPARILPLNLSARMQFNVTVTIGYIYRAKAVSRRMSGQTMGHVDVTGTSA